MVNDSSLVGGLSMIVVNWMPLALVGGFVAFAAMACIVEWRWLAAEMSSGHGAGLQARESRGPKPHGL